MKPEMAYSGKAERKCAREKCQKAFIPRRVHQVHCSADCRRMAWNEKRVIISRAPVIQIEREIQKMRRAFDALGNRVLALLAEPVTRKTSHRKRKAHHQ